MDRINKRSNWNKNETTILMNNFTSSKWEDLLTILPKKTEKQILSKARKLGLKKESEIFNAYYDDAKDVWVETHVDYDQIRCVVKICYPAKNKTLTFEESKNRVKENASKRFAEIVVIPRYRDFIKKIGCRYDTEEIRKLFSKFQHDLFFTTNEEERHKIVDKFETDFMNEIEKT